MKFIFYLLQNAPYNTSKSINQVGESYEATLGKLIHSSIFGAFATRI
jgi:hypothetical protein